MGVPAPLFEEDPGEPPFRDAFDAARDGRLLVIQEMEREAEDEEEPRA